MGETIKLDDLCSSIKINDATMNTDGTITLTASSGDTSTITIDPSVLTTSTNYYASTLSSNTATASTGYYSYNNGNTYSYSTNIDPWGPIEEKDPIKSAIEERLEDIFDKDDEMMPLVKNYLRKYLEKVMEAPEEIVKDLLQKETEIQKQKDEINSLKRQIEDLERRLGSIEIDRINQNSGLIWNGSTWINVNGSDINSWGNSICSNDSGLETYLNTNDIKTYISNTPGSSTNKNDTSTIA